MMISDFILLSKDHKQTILLHQGILIGKRKNGESQVFLFQLDLFYVEMYCNPQTKVVTEYQSFEKTSLLNPYLDSISIEHLFK
ncbi:MAG: hypothetical protein ACXWCZ_00360 [Flavisolibacter sp.]